ncbi:hypothetical protein [Microvirga thermotolerans]|uniref:Uncharacterized protein n=1 Tax=Microvirga thermotolerans TaxID=2651334 RepID=A0A5P9K3S7_9HYPH|nr:hypothetical protein [Microvirga thermotolerans]QFU16944.1 hypothetical protein GDR74_12340 [Microvirga thermotolerans]
MPLKGLIKEIGEQRSLTFAGEAPKQKVFYGEIEQHLGSFDEALIALVGACLMTLGQGQVSDPRPQ